MAIVKMKRLHLIALAQDRDALLASLRAAGWKCMGLAGGKRWTGKRCPAEDLCPPQMKLRYEKVLSAGGEV